MIPTLQLGAAGRRPGGAPAPSLTVTQSQNFNPSPPDCPWNTFAVTPHNFSGTPSYAWTYVSGDLPYAVSGASTATVTLGSTGDNCLSPITQSGVYRCTATFGAEVATIDVNYFLSNQSG